MEKIMAFYFDAIDVFLFMDRAEFWVVERRGNSLKGSCHQVFKEATNEMDRVLSRIEKGGDDSERNKRMLAYWKEGQYGE